MLHLSCTNSNFFCAQFPCQQAVLRTQVLTLYEIQVQVRKPTPHLSCFGSIFFRKGVLKKGKWGEISWGGFSELVCRFNAPLIAVGQASRLSRSVQSPFWHLQLILLPDNHRTNTLISKDFQQQGVRNPTVKNVSGVDALSQRAHATFHLGNHPPGNHAGFH